MREDLVSYLKNLRDQIISAFESLETPGFHFEREAWPYTKGHGGGEISLLRGEVFEKAAVNWSAVEGDKYPLGEEPQPFFATGVSVITHMRNPKAPTVHFNIRYIEAGSRSWLGGGFDLTPMGFPFEEDTQHFHEVARQSVEPFGENLYAQFSQQAREYYFIPHWHRERGVGGLFFDHYNTGDTQRDQQLWKSVGDHFLEAIMPIYHRRLPESYNEEDRQRQLRFRGQYAEFNLVYDRGTRFGFQSGGNPKAILCSMPPLAAW